jgi:hypothetical protein
LAERQKNQLNFVKIIFSRIYIVLRKTFFEIFFRKMLLIGGVYMIQKKFQKIYFKYFKIAIKYDRSNLFACSNLFVPTVVMKFPEFWTYKTLLHEM